MVGSKISFGVFKISFGVFKFLFGVIANTFGLIILPQKLRNNVWCFTKKQQKVTK